MDSKIKIAICGYGNLGKGVEKEITKSSDMELVWQWMPLQLPFAKDFQ